VIGIKSIAGSGYVSSINFMAGSSPLSTFDSLDGITNSLLWFLVMLLLWVPLRLALPGMPLLALVQSMPQAILLE
jgi:hypothetical protein